MREQYFYIYENLIYKRYFYEEHYGLSQKASWAYTALLIVLSFVCATAWSISKTQPVVWAMLIGICQLAQSFSGAMPFFVKQERLKYLIPELNSLGVKLDADWMKIENKDYDEHQICVLCCDYQEQFCALENRYSNDLYFGEWKWLLEKAENARDRYFDARYNISKETDTHDPSPEQATKAAAAAENAGQGHFA